MLADVIEEPGGGIHSKTTGSPIDHQLYTEPPREHKHTHYQIMKIFSFNLIYSF